MTDGGRIVAHTGPYGEKENVTFSISVVEQRFAGETPRFIGAFQTEERGSSTCIIVGDPRDLRNLLTDLVSSTIACGGLASHEMSMVFLHGVERGARILKDMGGRP